MLWQEGGFLLPCFYCCWRALPHGASQCMSWWFHFQSFKLSKTKINYDVHNLTKDTVELPTITDQKVTVNKHQNLNILGDATEQDVILFTTLRHRCKCIQAKICLILCLCVPFSNLLNNWRSKLKVASEEINPSFCECSPILGPCSKNPLQSVNLTKLI